MTNRADDWLKQAEYDLEHAQASHDLGHNEWSCLSAQQSSEKAVKVIFYTLTADVWGHGIARLLENLPETIPVDDTLLSESRMLDRHYIPARYPNGLVTGTPRESYTELDSTEAIRIAKKILKFCKNTISTIKGNNTT